MAIFSKLKGVWNAFTGRDPTPEAYTYSYFSSHSTHSSLIGGKRSTVSAIYNQIAVDCGAIDIKHVRLDEEGRYKETIDDELNWVLTRSANIDQTGRSLIRDAVFSMLEEGVAAIVPIDTDGDPYEGDSYTIETVRVGKIVEWMPHQVRVEIYDDRDGVRKQRLLDKRFVVILENPFYSIMNEPNAVAQRLQRVNRQLDKLNDEAVANKLDLIIQLPYVIKSEARKKQAEERRKEIIAQLTGNQYGIAYTDGTERIVQLNRSLENNLWEQSKELQAQMYNQLGFSETIYNGTADEKTMLNYQNRTIEPILTTIVEEMERKWLSRTAIRQRQAIRFYKNPFKLVPVNQLAEIVDKFTRNEVMSSNEFRSIVGLKPSKDPKADQLINSNLNQPEDKEKQPQEETSTKNVGNSKEKAKVQEILKRFQNQ